MFPAEIIEIILDDLNGNRSFRCLFFLLQLQA